MDNRPALLCDRSTAFSDRLRRILLEVGYDARTVTGHKALLKSVKTDQPSIVFIAVDLPRKLGFSLFSDVKLAIKQIPIVLITGSVPPEEMRIHRSLQVHADAYLDKRSLDDLELLTTLRRLLRLELSDRDLEGLAWKLRSIEPSGSSQSEESLEAEIDQCISWDDAPSEVPAKSDTSPVEPDAEFIQRPAESRESRGHSPESSATGSSPAPQAELERLKKELEEMRSAVSSTPFSEEYSSLKSRVRKSEEEAETLREQLSSQLQHVRDLEGKLIDAEFQVRNLQDSRDSAQEQVRSLEQQLAQTVRERLSVEHEWARSMEEVKSRSQDEKLQAARSAAEKATKKIEAFQKKQSETLATASEHSRREIAEAVEANDAAWRSKMADIDKKNAKALEARTAEQKKEITRLIADHAKKILEKETELKETMTRAAAAHEEDLAASTTRWKARLEKTREELESGRSADSSALEARYRKELNELRSHHIKERERLQKMHTEGLESLSAKLRHDCQDLTKIKSPLLRSKLEEKLKERESELAAQVGGGGEES
jgi:CheY-like chemotaxis protein